MKFSRKMPLSFLPPTDGDNCHCSKSGVTMVAIDFAGADDWSTEVEYEKLPDGTLLIKDVRQWRKEIDHDD